MLPLPRIAVGTLQPGSDFRPILWALMEAFRVKGLQVQSFLSQACFARYHGAADASGLNPRHLDSWLMSADLCREIFHRAAGSCDLAVVEGDFHAAPGNQPVGGSLDTLCQWLDLPRIVVLDAARIEGGRLPDRPQQVDAVLLDRADDPGRLARLTAAVKSHWGVPVLGSLPELSQLRAEIDSCCCARRRPLRAVCWELGSHFLGRSDPERIIELGFGHEISDAPSQCCLPEPTLSRLVVALAHDDAMNCYFADTLDLLERQGAKIVDFSPLKDERLPSGAQLVYIGCGHPERYAEELARNDCMKLALRNHLCSGGRLYAEGGGLAYLCQQIEVDRGEFCRGAGIFPAVARRNPVRQAPTPVEVTIRRDIWLARRGQRLRGYRNCNWLLEPAGSLSGCVEEEDRRYDVVENSPAIGSQLHLNFVAQPGLVPGLLDTGSVQAGPADPWA